MRIEIWSEEVRVPVDQSGGINHCEGCGERADKGHTVLDCLKRLRWQIEDDRDVIDNLGEDE